jgi:hypothetical protein
MFRAAQASRHRLADPGEGRDDVDVEDFAGDIGVDVQHRPVDRVDPRVVDQVVQPTEPAARQGDRVVLVLWVGGVAGQPSGIRVAAQRRHRLGEGARVCAP